MKKTKLLLTALLLLVTAAAYAQDITVTGTVTDAGTGETIVGASVVLKGSTAHWTMTDDHGAYSLTVPSDGVLEVTFLGYTTQEIPINGRTSINVELSPEATTLDDVIVVAYGTATKESLTGAVSTVRSEAIERRPISSATAALEGTVAGVQINNSYGEPGSDPDIRIRGFNSISGSNSPLIVLDGVPMGGNISDLNPADIASISVLKDASSAALYGNRAANGVVMITTKAGNIGEEKLTVNLTINQGFYNRGVPEYDRLNSVQYMEAFFQAIRNGEYTSNMDKYASYSDANAAALQGVQSALVYNIFNKNWSELYDANGKIVSDAYILPGIAEDLDWYEPMERLGYRQQYNLNASGGTKKTSYFVSVGYNNEKGFIKYSDGERLTGRANVSAQPVKWLKVGANIAGSHQIYHSMTGDSGNSSNYKNPFMFARQMAPIYPVHLHDLTTGDYVLDDMGNKQFDGGAELGRPQYNERHVIWEYELDQNVSYRTTVNATAFAEINFLKDFKFRVNGDMSIRNSLAQSYDNSTIGNGKDLGRMSQTEYMYKSYTFQQQLMWNRDFGKHNVDVLLAHENYWYWYNYTYLFKQEEKFAGMMNLSNFTTMNTMTGYDNNYRTESYLGRVKYNYDERYFIEGSYRYDGSSRFYPENRWGSFWSVGASWVISSEPWMQNVSWIDMLKLRAAYGEVGQDAGAGYYAWQALYTSTQNGLSGAAYKSQLAAMGISWETSQSASIAVEARMFNRWNFTLEFFNKTSKDLLFDVTLPSSMGSTSTGSSNPDQTMNFGSIANVGLEFSTDVDIIRNRDWLWNAGLNITTLKNTILELPDQYAEEGQISGTKKYMVGHGIYDFWMYKYQGIDLSDGHALFKFNDKDYYIDDPNVTGPAADKGEDKTEAPADGVRVIDGVPYATSVTYAEKDWSGSAIPDFYGSFNTSLTWRNFTLSALMTFQVGGQILDYSYANLMGTSTSPSAMHVDNLKAWTPDNMGTGVSKEFYPALNTQYNSENYTTSDFFLIDASYFVLKNITLSYQLPRNVVEKMKLSGFGISVSCDNAVTVTQRKGMNPQQSFNGLNYNAYVPARIFSVGLNLKF